MAIKTQGTQLYFIDETSAGCEVIAVDCATSMTGLSNPREQIEVTCLESDTRQYEGGLSTPGQLTVSINFDPAQESHMRLYELWKLNGPNSKFAIGLGQPVNVAPTVDSACEFEYPITRTFVEFEGYIADIPLEIALNSVVTTAVSIQVSGAYTIFPRT